MVQHFHIWLFSQRKWKHKPKNICKFSCSNTNPKIYVNSHVHCSIINDSQFIHTHTHTHTHTYIHTYTGIELFKHMIVLFLMFCETSILFSIEAVPIYIPIPSTVFISTLFTIRQDMEATQVAINRQIDKKLWYIYTMYCSTIKKEWNYAIYINMDGTRE